jgi:uncharacterized glyoxalase superfamily metalloenzyme YdcJ
VLLRQTSFRALAEPRAFRLPDGSEATGSLRVRFGEVEARGIALTRAGRDVYDRAIAEVAARAGITSEQRHADKVEVWRRDFPADEAGLAEQGLAYFTYDVVDGVVVREPIVYEDFLPQSAAGIFASNLTSDGTRDEAQAGLERDAEWLAGALERDLADPFELYAAQSEASARRVADLLGVAPEQISR